ncbi:hypothetical protein [Sulfitobacter sp. 1A15106]|uniref:hypothetical protein n=1 Tax=Sulfitobacter sp. 1A15106 TaxID=3368590 RepID=UPI003744E636
MTRTVIIDMADQMWDLRIVDTTPHDAEGEQTFVGSFSTSGLAVAALAVAAEDLFAASEADEMVVAAPHHRLQELFNGAQSCATDLGDSVLMSRLRADLQL